VTLMLDTASVSFREVRGPDGWRIDVLVDAAVCGHIDHAGDSYRYFEGPQNDVIWSFADVDLPRLEARIRTTLSRDSLLDRM
jgi:hypothetical protein